VLRVPGKRESWRRRLIRGRSLISLREVPIPFSRKSRRNVVRQATRDGAKKSTRVSLRPGSDWRKRNFLTSVLIPSLFVKRSGEYTPPQFPKILPGQMCVTWIGHASFLIQTHEVNVLIDPNWAKWLKVIKRLKQPGFEIRDLPAIDFVLVTHAHFDHLDRRTLRRVAADQPIVVPIGVGNLVHDLGFHIVHELDYWQKVKLGPIEVALTPCYHWGARFLADLHRGFGGFVTTADGRTIFHCGDSAFFPGFREIGEHYDIDIALLPIGAYDSPTGREVHMNPEEALKAFIELRAKTLVPMHYGTFRLGYEPLHEPLERLLAAARAHGVENKVLVMTEGKPVVL
jgi:L-ascorbate metabolism protein UlaG (beta-lactamase superfamily)